MGSEMCIRDRDGDVKTHGVFWLDVLDVARMEGTHHAHKGRGNGIGLDFCPVDIDPQRPRHILIVFDASQLKSQTRLSEPVEVKDAEKEKPEDDIVVVDIFLENEPQKIRRSVLDGRDPEPAGCPNEVPHLKDVLEYQGRGDGGDGKIVAFEPEKGIPDDEGPKD